MKKILYRIIPVLIISMVFLSSQAQTTAFQLHADSKVVITGSSTLHDWTGKVQSYEGKVQFLDNFLSKKIKKGPAIESVLVTFKVEGIDGGRGPAMNKKITAALKNTEHPTIQFQSTEPISVTEIVDKAQKLFKVTLKGDLSMAGVTQAIEMELNGKQLEDGNYHFSGERAMKMSDFKIDPPSAMFGQIQTKDDISIAFDLKLVKG